MTTDASGVETLTARTSSQMLSDLGAQASGNYLTSFTETNDLSNAVTLKKSTFSVLTNTKLRPKID